MRNWLLLASTLIDRRDAAWFRFVASLSYVGIAGAVAVGIMLVANFWPHQSSVALSVQTRGLEIKFTGDGTSRWKLGKAKFCIRINEPAPAASSRGALADCDPRLYRQLSDDNAEIAWGRRARLRLTKAGPDGDLYIFVVSPGEVPFEISGSQVTANSLFRIDPKAWDDTSALPFKGELVLGAVPSGGANDYLISGRYEIRQTLFGQTTPVKVQSGDFFSGDQVRMVADGDPAEAIVEGFIGPSTSDPAIGVSVLAFSPPGESKLLIERMGVEKSFISANWIDRATKDPLLLALSAIMALFVSVRELVVRMRSAS